MGSPFGGNSSSSPSDNRIAATDQAQVIKGKVKQLTEAGGLTQGKNSSVVGAGANQVDAGQGSTVVLNDPQAALAALDAITTVSTQNGNNLTDALQSAQQSQSDLAQQISGLLGAQNGAPAANATPWALYGGLALAGLVVIALIWRKS